MGQRFQARWPLVPASLVFPLFAEVDNCYSLTVHNSQGSTFEQGVIDSQDLLKRLYVGDESEQKKLKEYHRLWYVGSSRMQKKLLFT